MASPQRVPDKKLRRASGALVSDLLASVVVFLVALPLCMGIAIASGAPPTLGIVSGIIGGLVVGFLQGSPLQVSGPAAGLAVLVFELVQRRGLVALGPILLVGGAAQLLAGLLRGGRWFRAVPPSVIHGMLAGIGVLIAASQFHVMIDDAPRARGWQNLATIPSAVLKALSPGGALPHHQAAAIGLVTIATIVFWSRYASGRAKVVPAPLLGAAVATLIANALRLPIAYVRVPDDIVGSLAVTDLARFRVLLDPSAWLSGAAIGFIASAETLLCATAVDRMHQGPRTDYNRELAAQGVGNVLCGIAGALPITGVIVRSSANVQAGARTRRSAIFHGAWMLVLIAAFPALLRTVPVSALGAILVYTGYKLVNPAAIRELRRYGRAEVAIYALTLATIVATDLLKGVLLGLAVAVGRILYHLSRLSIRVEDDAQQGTTVIHLNGSATFLRLPDIAETLDRVPADRHIVVRFDDLDYIDHATLETLHVAEQQHRAKGGSVAVDWSALEDRYFADHGPRDAGATA